MNVNNFDMIKQMLQFSNDDDFYFLQIILRRKENKSITADSIVIKSYYIDSHNSFDKKMKEIKSLCIIFNARAYINLSKRSYEKAALISLCKHAEHMLNKEYKSFSRIYDSACGEISGESKRWIIDIDNENIRNIDVIINQINKIELNNKDSMYPVVICTIPTPNGAHLITHPFNLQKFQPIIELYRLDIHKNNPTVLFYEKNIED